MARYIDADALMEKIRRCEFDITGRGIVYDAGEVQSIINFMPTADVAPKSEVEKQKLEIWRLQGEVEQLRHRYELAVAEREANVRGFTEELQKAKAEVAREIFAAIEFDIHNLDFDREETRAIAIEGVIAKCKKEYTEGEQDGN